MSTTGGANAVIDVAGTINNEGDINSTNGFTITSATALDGNGSITVETGDLTAESVKSNASTITMTMNSGGTLTVASELTNNGSNFFADGGALVGATGLDGTVALSISGDVTMADLEGNNSNIVIGGEGSPGTLTATNFSNNYARSWRFVLERHCRHGIRSLFH
jgi:hypothetical protein